MGCCFPSKRVKIKAIDNISKGKRYDYLRAKGELILSIDETYGVPLINVNFNDWHVNSTRLWPRNDKARHCVQCQRQRTRLDSPSLSPNNSLDTVH